jgi:hypothetical protein
MTTCEVSISVIFARALCAIMVEVDERARLAPGRFVFKAPISAVS